MIRIGNLAAPGNNLNLATPFLVSQVYPHPVLPGLPLKTKNRARGHVTNLPTYA